MVDKIKQGKKNRKAGKDFEKKVREDLESKGWIVDRWTNTIETTLSKERHTGNAITTMKLAPSKPKYNPFTKAIMMLSGGFPDFIIFQKRAPEIQDKLGKNTRIAGSDQIWGVECKSNGYLTKLEREKCKWLLDNGIFSKILIAKKSKKPKEIIYNEYQT